MPRRPLGELKASKNYTVRLTPAQALFFELVLRDRGGVSPSEAVKEWLTTEGEKRYSREPRFLAFRESLLPAALPVLDGPDECPGSGVEGYETPSPTGVEQRSCSVCLRVFATRGRLTPKHNTAGVLVEELAPGSGVVRVVEDAAERCQFCGCTESKGCEQRRGMFCSWARPGVCLVCAVIYERAQELYDAGEHNADELVSALQPHAMTEFLCVRRESGQRIRGIVETVIQQRTIERQARADHVETQRMKRVSQNRGTDHENDVGGDSGAGVVVRRGGDVRRRRGAELRGRAALHR